MSNSFNERRFNELEHEAEGAECAHMYLDRLYVAREYEGQTLSLVGRLGLLRNKLATRARFYTHHALWGGLWEGVMPEAVSQFAVRLANRIADSISAELAINVGIERYRHKKRGSTYVRIGLADIQSSNPVAEGTTMVLYRSEQDGRYWVRPVNEFYDGRFERIDHLSDHLPTS